MTIQYSRWQDVQPEDWFYQDVMELSNVVMPDGEFFIYGIPYSGFKAGANRVQEVMFATADNQSTFTMKNSYTPNPQNPLRVFINGSEGVFDETKTSGTKLQLLTGVPKGTQVVAVAVGIPNVDANGQPIGVSDNKHYPYKQLSNGMRYLFDPYGGRYEYAYCFGRQLERIDMSEYFVFKNYTDAPDVAEKYWPVGADKDDESKAVPLTWAALRDALFRAFKYKKNCYTVVKWHVEGDPVSVGNPAGDTNPNQLRGMLFTSHDLNGLPVTLKYSAKDLWGNWYPNGVEEKDLVVVSTQPTYIDRFFPNAQSSRAELIAMLDRMRRVLYGSFTDSSAAGYYTDKYGVERMGFDEKITSYNGQRVVRSNGWFEMGGALTVKIGAKRQTLGKAPSGSKPATGDYYELDNHSIVFNKPLESGKTIRMTFDNDPDNSRFIDIQGPVSVKKISDNTYVDIDGSNAWYTKHVLAMEQEMMDDGSFLIEGYAVKYYAVDNDDAPIVNNDLTPPSSYTGGGAVEDDRGERMFVASKNLNRFEAVSLLNRFRKWCLERFM